MIEKEQNPTSYIQTIDESIVLSQDDCGSADVFAFYSLLVMKHPHVINTLLRAILLTSAREEGLFERILKSYEATASIPLSKNTPFDDFRSSPIATSLGADESVSSETRANYYYLIRESIASLKGLHRAILDEDADDDTMTGGDVMMGLDEDRKRMAIDKTMRLQELQLHLQAFDSFLEKNDDVFEGLSYAASLAAPTPIAPEPFSSPVSVTEQAALVDAPVTPVDTFHTGLLDALHSSSFFNAFISTGKTQPQTPGVASESEMPIAPTSESHDTEGKEGEVGQSHEVESKREEAVVDDDTDDVMEVVDIDDDEDEEVY